MKFICYTNQELAPVAQLDRALDSDSKGRWFESSRAYQERSLKQLRFRDLLFLKERTITLNSCILMICTTFYNEKWGTSAVRNKVKTGFIWMS